LLDKKDEKGLKNNLVIPYCDGERTGIELKRGLPRHIAVERVMLQGVESGN
jgi:hypothetical protein